MHEGPGHQPGALCIATTTLPAPYAGRVPNLIGSAQGLVSLVLWISAMAVVGVALVDALRQPRDAYPVVGRLTKPVWVTILAVALACIFTFGVTFILSLAGTVAGIVYLVDTRVKLREVRGGGSSSSGPYGGW